MVSEERAAVEPLSRRLGASIVVVPQEVLPGMGNEKSALSGIPVVRQTRTKRACIFSFGLSQHLLIGTQNWKLRDNLNACTVYFEVESRLTPESFDAFRCERASLLLLEECLRRCNASFLKIPRISGGC